MTDLPTTGTAAGPGVDVSERFAAHVGVRVGRRHEPEAEDLAAGTDGCDVDGTCEATATLTGRPPWLSPTASDGSGTEAAPVPTAAVLALVDAVARAAAEAAVTASGRRVTLVPTATGVQYLASASGALHARGSVPHESEPVDRTDERGMVRFSVAVEVLDSRETRVASASVQWVATVHDIPGGR
jgi:hypothetical protein